MTPRARTRRSGRSCRTCARSEPGLGCTREETDVPHPARVGARCPFRCPFPEASLPAPVLSPGTWRRCSCCRAPRRRRSRSCTCGWGSSHRWASSRRLPCCPAGSAACPRAALTRPAATACSAWSWRRPQVPAPLPFPSGLGGGAGQGPGRAAQPRGLLTPLSRRHHAAELAERQQHGLAGAAPQQGRHLRRRPRAHGRGRGGSRGGPAAFSAPGSRLLLSPVAGWPRMTP